MALLSRRVRSNDWKPIGVTELEPNALAAVRSNTHISVIAGPGAGKTELLAQRASYLLQTGESRTPQRILAISFKRDAATNLAARVRRRSHRSHASRLDSLTFDAFAKSLIDRFGQALPERWRPRPDYEILWTNDKLYRRFLDTVGAPPPEVGTKADIMAITVKAFEREHLLGSPLPVEGWSKPSPAQWAVGRFWQASLHKGKKSHLSFPMIGRLAELLLCVNPTVAEGLRLTYSHLFMDEFQDTTRVQYDLVRRIFLNSNTVVTSVGDNKQQIMRWANAMDNPFAVFEADFMARRTPLYNNYRSSPELVRIQHVLAQALDATTVEPISKAESAIDGESCAIWDFPDPGREAEVLARFVVKQAATHNLHPRDFVLLVRQKASEYATVLAPAFEAKGLSLRNEAAEVGAVVLQELLSEEISAVLLSTLRLAMSSRAGAYWSECQDAMAELFGVAPDDDAARARLARELDNLAKDLSRRFPVPTVDQAATNELVGAIVNFVGEDRFLAAHPAYRQGDWFDKLVTAAGLHLQASSKGASDWREALDAYEGLHAVPLMTIHKCKGLEYHTVIFVGLDDGAWWSFDSDKIEATAGFFVAFTRAKQRVVFTYCKQHGNRTKIDALYRLLQAAGVKRFVSRAD